MTNKLKMFFLFSLLIFASPVFAVQKANIGISLAPNSDDEEMYLSEISSVDVDGDFSSGNVPLIETPDYSNLKNNDDDEYTLDRIDENTSLSDVLEKRSTQKESRDTWLDRLRAETVTELKRTTEKKSAKEIVSDEDTSSLRSMVEDSKSRTGKSNVAVFDISGIMLRMSPIQIDDILTKRGYRKTFEKFEIPNFIKWRKEDECRAAGVVGFERLASCVVQLSKKEKYEYVDTVKYSKFDSKESLTILFTSNFTNNKSFKIEYVSEAGMIRGNTQKANYMRNIKIFDFWKRISQKYGTPDNKDDVIWGMGGNKPYMQAATGRIIIEDPMLRELDYTRMSREDQRFINTNIYNF